MHLNGFHRLKHNINFFYFSMSTSESMQYFMAAAILRPVWYDSAYSGAYCGAFCQLKSRCFLKLQHIH